MPYIKEQELGALIQNGDINEFYAKRFKTIKNIFKGK